ncbi:MAG: type II toxin-antitoxin system VapC family toxin [Anaerolineales bacterium]|jgi:predicted nucleic acid-binding protein|nr:type II toxin-antitoxin system VapC family toxin [Anaerolineales bacterium]
MTNPVVIDANIACYCVLHTPQSEVAARCMDRLARSGDLFFAPGLWWQEITSVIHRYHFDGLITETVAYAALEILGEKWEIQRVEVPVRKAFDWATRLHQKAAYDGFYLAAAEQLGAEFWSADQMLVANARQAGAGWVHWMEELL